MMVFLFIPFMGLLNRLRGWNPADVNPTLLNKICGWTTDRIPCTLYLMVFVWLLTSNYILTAIIGVGWWLWSMPGWGDYFDFSDRPNNEQGWIDNITQNDAVAMALRGLYIVPLFLALAIYFKTLWIAPVGLSGALMGPIYWAWLANKPSPWKFVWAEVCTGLLHGVMLAGVLGYVG